MLGRAGAGSFSFYLFLFSSLSFPLVLNTDIASVLVLITSQPRRSPTKAERRGKNDDEERKNDPSHPVVSKAASLRVLWLCI